MEKFILRLRFFWCIADVYAVAQVMAFEALTGRRVEAKGFQMVRDDFGVLFAVQTTFFADYSATEQQEFAESAFLRGSKALRLRRAGQTAKAQSEAREFLDDWANGKTPGTVPGTVKLLTPLSTPPAAPKKR